MPISGVPSSTHPCSPCPSSAKWHLPRWLPQPPNPASVLTPGMLSLKWNCDGVPLGTHFQELQLPRTRSTWRLRLFNGPCTSIHTNLGPAYPPPLSSPKQDPPTFNSSPSFLSNSTMLTGSPFWAKHLLRVSHSYLVVVAIRTLSSNSFFCIIIYGQF